MPRAAQWRKSADGSVEPVAAARAANSFEEGYCFLGDGLPVFLNEMTCLLHDERITAVPNHGLQGLHDRQAQDRVLRADGH